MDKEIMSISNSMKGGILDDDYTLYNDGTVLHEYDRHSSPGGQNLKENLTINDLSKSIKQRLFDAASKEQKELVRKTLKLDEA